MCLLIKTRIIFVNGPTGRGRKMRKGEVVGAERKSVMGKVTGKGLARNDPHQNHFRVLEQNFYQKSMPKKFDHFNQVRKCVALFLRCESELFVLCEKQLIFTCQSNVSNDWTVSLKFPILFEFYGNCMRFGVLLLRRTWDCGGQKSRCSSPFVDERIMNSNKRDTRVSN